VQLDQRIQVVELHLGQQRRANHACVVDQRRDLEALRQLAGGLRGGDAVGQVDFDAVEFRMVDVAGPARERHDFVAAREQVFADGAADASAAAGDRGDL